MTKEMVAWLSLAVLSFVPGQARPPLQARAAVATTAMSNADVVKLTKAGFTDDTIEANIRQAKRRAFRLDADSLIALKTAGVSERVIQVMMHPDATESVPSPAASPLAPPSTAHFNPPPIADRPVPSPSKATTGLESPSPGIYVAPSGSAVGAVALEPNVFSNAGGSFWKTALTYGIAKSKFTARVAGPKARQRVPTGRQVFYFVFEQKSPGLGNSGGFAGWLASATSANEFVLVEMTPKADRRELVVGEMNAFSSSSGTRSEDVVPTKIDKLAPSIYRVETTEILQGGEFCFFYAAGMGTYGQGVVGKLFDFGVDSKPAPATASEIDVSADNRTGGDREPGAD